MSALRGQEIQPHQYGYLAARFRAGAVVKRTSLTEEFDFAAFKEMYGGEALPIFLINESGKLQVCTSANPSAPKPGQTLISIVDPVEKPK